MLPPAPVLDALKVGEALAAYGIGKNRLPLQGGVEHLPPWLRIPAGGGGDGHERLRRYACSSGNTGSECS
jgi:hypothetical protein